VELTVRSNGLGCAIGFGRFPVPTGRFNALLLRKVSRVLLSSLNHMTLTSPLRAVGNRERLVDRVVAEVERAIIAGQLAPDTNLPPERELALQLGVSRTVVREAVRILVAKGLVEARHGLGTTVRRVTQQQIAQPLSLLLQTSHGSITVEHLYGVRSILEIEIAGLAAAQATPAEIEQLRTAYEAMVAAQELPALLAERDAEFHQSLARLTHNPLLVILSDSIFDVLREYLQRMAPRLDPHRNVLPYHWAIYEQVAANQVEGARQAMREHFRNDAENRRRVFGAPPPGLTPLELPDAVLRPE
jgi:DNA-binding FadR family transcriptional regulator